MKKKLLAALLATAMTVTMFAGCGTPGSKDSKKDDSSASSGKKRITYTLREDLPSMDPQNSNSISCATAEICTYAMLTRNVEGEVKPDAAESWDISDDGLTYTFHLRDGLKSRRLCLWYPETYGSRNGKRLRIHRIYPQKRCRSK